jgi:hypothetical protein
LQGGDAKAALETMLTFAHLGVRPLGKQVRLRHIMA